MIKNLFVIGSLGLGGAETQLLLLIVQLKKRGVLSELFVLEASGPLRKLLEVEGVNFHDGGFDSGSPRWSKVFQLIFAFFKLWLIAYRKKPAVLHAYLPLTNFLGALAGRMAGVPLVVTSRRALGTHQDRHPFWKKFDWLSGRLSHYVTVNSLAVAEDTVFRDDVDPGKIRLIYNGLDFARFSKSSERRKSIRISLGLGDDETGVVVVGNLIPYKGHADLLYAISNIRNKNQCAARYFFVGEDRGVGASLGWIRTQLGLKDVVDFLGRREDVADIMNAMDVFVMPSHEEGFSNALLEAMASGLAIVATDVGGNPEALEDGACGILVPPHNPPALAAAIEKFLVSKELRLNYGLLARKAVREKYSIEAMVNAHLALYQQERHG